MPTTQTTPTVTTFSPTIGTPTRGTSERELDTFNKQLRSSPLYQNFMRSRGLRTDGHVKLSRKQQSDLEKAMASAGFRVPGGMHIDQGGNLNQKNRLGRNVAIAAAIAGGTIATLGAAGAFAPAAFVGPTAAGAGGTAAGATAAGTAAGTGGLLASTPALGMSTIPAAATMAGTGATTASAVGTAAALNAANIIGGTGGVVSAPALTSVPAAAGYAQLATPVVSNVARGGGMTAGNYIDIGSRGVDFLSNWMGGRAANQSNDRASQLTAQSNAALLELEREKLRDLQEQQKRKEAVEERNFQIAQEERLDEMRRREQAEAAIEPLRMAREGAYRNYMKKYYGIDVAPSVARAPRTFADPAIKTPTSSTMPVPAPQKSLAALATPTSIVPAELPQQRDPWFVSDPMTYRRPYQRETE